VQNSKSVPQPQCNCGWNGSCTSVPHQNQPKKRGQPVELEELVGQFDDWDGEDIPGAGASGPGV